MVKPWIRQALVWAVAGLGYNAEDVAEMLTSE